ncbi:glycosyltransferase [Synechococcus sp. CS-1331]|uniref:glycosyltransferase n=1 Tax=Synechococcus sp. CS-1331 TaxID=2847973 RepID=UPI00223B2396|nr:glycosyltransferase [Synechococcus sp. CS-1331]MCT0227617.1 glycosyltransferase [Synechococcus sp. CS-1331]
MALNITHVNAYDLEGGASRAAYRIHRSLADYGEDLGLRSQMRVIHQQSDDRSVIGGTVYQSRMWASIHTRLSRRSRQGFQTINPSWHSYAWPNTGLGKEMERRHLQGEADVVHLHWMGDSTLSIEEIGRLTMPLVWTMHDQWGFCGAEHYTSPPDLGETESSDERFVLGYPASSRPIQEAGPDLTRRTWLRKKSAWQRAIQIVTPSNWMAECVRRSALMREWPVKVIPYPIDLTTWAPFDQRQARSILQLPPDRPLVLFGAVGGTADSRKGADLMLKALQRLKTELAETPLAQLELVVFGQSEPAEQSILGFPIHYIGKLKDNISLRLLYAAADVMIVPSRQEAFGQTASEAHACGTPVVAFRTGGLVDIIDERITGALAEPFDPNSLAQSLRWVLEDTQRLRQLGTAARCRAEKLWDPKKVCRMYYDLYQELANT